MGESHGDRYSWGGAAETVPDQVADHLPPSDNSRDFIYTAQFLDTETGLPLHEGAVGEIRFTRIKYVDSSTIAVHVNYLVTQDGEAFGVERRITCTEHGPHVVEEKYRRLAATGDARYGSTAQSAKSALRLKIDRYRRNGALAAVKAKVKLSVPRDEAQQVIDYVRGIKKTGDKA